MSSPVTAEIDALVAALGGVQPPDLPTFGTAPLLAEFLAASGLALDEAFLHLTSRYGGGYFSDTVEFNVRERVPIARAGNRMALGRLLGWHRGTMSIPRVDVELGDQLPLDLLPFADVGQGDLLCLAVPVEWDPARSDDDGPVPHDRADELRTRPGAIWYWHHESPEGGRPVPGRRRPARLLARARAPNARPSGHERLRRPRDRPARSLLGVAGVAGPAATGTDHRRPEPTQSRCRTFVTASGRRLRGVR
jgi:hypothetical protein